MFKSYPIKDMNLKKINSPFGMRMHPVYKVMKLHEGIDYPAPAGTPVLSVADGIVVISKMQSNGQGYGNYIVIDHGEFDTIYAHLRERFVKAGQKVYSGQTIGTVGTTGSSTGNHLHFGVCKRFSGKDWFDPMPYLQKIKGDDEVIEKGKFIIDGKEIELDRIFKEDKNFVELKDIIDAFGFIVDYDAKKKMPVITTK